MELVIAIVVVALLGTVAAVLFKRKQARDGLPPEVRDGIARARDLRKQWRQAEKTLAKSAKSATSDLSLIESAEGRKLKSLGGVTLYERWIVTPQGAGSLLGVKAEAADESNLRQRITATRLVTLGVFALAAPKKKGSGNAYVVIEGPAVSGVATISAQNNQNAGPQAFSFAADINNAARAAEAAEPGRPAAIAEGRQRLKTASDRSTVDALRVEYVAAVSALPTEFQVRFGDSVD